MNGTSGKLAEVAFGRELGERSTGNVFADMGLPAPEECLLKAQIAGGIYDAVLERRLTLVQASALTGLNETAVSSITEGDLEGYSIDELVGYLRALGKDLRITVFDRQAEAPRSSHAAGAESSLQTHMGERAARQPGQRRVRTAA